MCTCSCTPYIALFSVLSAINIGIGTSFVYYEYMNHETKSQLKSFKQKFTGHIKKVLTLRITLIISLATWLI